MSQTPRQWFRIEQASADVAEVSIFDEISPWGVTAQDFVAEISKISAKEVKLHLNTPGGDVYDGIAIYNAIKDHPARFAAYIPGLAASIGTIIAMAADEITIAPHARMMIHDAWAMAAGNAEDMAKLADRLEATSQNLAAIYADRAPAKTADEWRALMKAETWYTDQEAVDAGLADAVGRSNDKKPLKQAALFDLSRYQYGEREAARLALEVAEEEVSADVHACVCGADECPLTAKHEEPAAPAPSNKYEQEREALEAALASVRL